MIRRLTVLVGAVLLGFVLGLVWNRYLPVFRVTSDQGLSPGVPVPETVSGGTYGETAGFSHVVEAVRPAVVHIISALGTRALHPPPRGKSGPASPGLPDPGEEENTGSGVIVAADGIIVTNYHVVGSGEHIRVLLQDRREFEGTVAGVDPRTDLAVIKIDADNLPVVRWGNSDSLKVGEYVLAMGSPFGLSSTVTMGIVSATGRTGVGITDYEDFIQTDAAINPGNSGGPLLNVRGELVGINTAIVSEHGGFQGIGFAVPSNLARAVVTQLTEIGVVRRGWLGIAVQEVDPSLALKLGVGEVRGALVAEIEARSTARDSGLLPGDVIMSFDGKDVVGTADFRNRVATAPVGRDVELTAVRDGRMMTFHVPVGEQKDGAAAGTGDSNRGSAHNPGRDAHEGMNVGELSSGVKKQLDLPPGLRGVLVAKVERGAGAWKAGLRRGDIILEVNRKPVASLADYREARQESGSSFLLYILRAHQKFFILLDAPVDEG